MKKVKSGIAFHEFHDKLVSLCLDYDKRVEVIRMNKPKSEQELRLRLFQIIPDDRLPPNLAEALAAFKEAWTAYDEALKALDEAGKACDEAQRAFDEALKALDEAGKACDFEALHKKLCPDCPWDGKTIFPKSKKGGE